MSGSVTFEKITTDEAWQVFDRAARTYLDMDANDIAGAALDFGRNPLNLHSRV